MAESLSSLYNRERMAEDRLIRSKDRFEQERMQQALRYIRKEISYAQMRAKRDQASF